MPANKSKTIAKVLLLAMGLNIIAPVTSSIAADEAEIILPAEEKGEEIKEAEAEVIEKQAEVETAKVELAEAVENLKTAEAEKADADEKVEEAKKDVAAKEEAKNTAEEELQTAVKAKDTAEAELAQLQEKKLEQEKDVKEAEVALAEAQDEQKAAKKLVDDAQSEVDQAKDKLDEAEKELADAERVITESKEKRNLNDAAADYGSAKKDADVIAEEIKELDKQDPSVEDQAAIDAEAELVDEAQNALYNANNDYEDLLLNIDEANEKIDNKNEEISAKKQRLAELNDKAADSEYVGKLSQAELLDLKDQIDDLKTEINVSEAELDGLYTDLDELEASKADANKAREDAYNKLVEAQSKATTQKKVDATNEARFDILAGIITDENISEEIRKADSKITDAQNKLDKSKQEETKLREKLVDAEKEIKKIKEQIKELTSFPNVNNQNAETAKLLEVLLEEQYDIIDGLNGELEIKRFDQEEYRENIADAQARKTALESFQGRLNEVSSDDDTVNKLLKDYKTAKEELDDAYNYYLEMRDSFEEISRTAGAYQYKVSLAREEFEDKTAKKEVLDNDLTTANKNLEAAKSELERLRSDLESSPDRVTAEDIEKAQRKHASAWTAQVNAENEAKKAESELIEAKENLDVAKEIADQAQDKVDQAQAIVDQARENLSYKENDLAIAKEALKVEEAKENLKDDLAEARNIDNPRLNRILDEIEVELGNAITIEQVNYLQQRLKDALALINGEEPGNPDPEVPVVDELASLKDLYKGFIDKLSKLSPSEKDAFKELIDKADSRAKIQSIYTDAIAKNNKELGNVDKPVDPEPETPVVDELASLKDLYKGFIDTLSKLSPAEKAAFKELIDKADSRAKIQSIYNDAIAKNNKKLTSVDKPVDPNPVDPKPVDPVVDGLEAYRDLISSYIRGLSKLSPVEKDLYIARVQAAKTRAEVQAIYNQAIGLNNGRIIREFQPVDPILPQPQSPEISRPVYPTPGPVVNRPTDDSEVLEVSSDIIYIPAGYKNFKAGFYSKAKLVKEYKILLKAYNANVITVRSAKMLLEEYPKTVAPVKDKLEALLKTATDLQKEALTMLNEYKEVLKLDKTLA